MPRLKIRHESLYSYSQPVRFGPWRLLMRPLDTHATRLISASLETPPASVKWTYDAYGNCVCHLEPTGSANFLKVVNNLVVDRFPAPLANVDINNPYSRAPIIYSLADRAILDPFITPSTGDDDGLYRDWLRAQIREADEPALDFLQRINTNIHDTFLYGAREEAGGNAKPG